MNMTLNSSCNFFYFHIVHYINIYSYILWGTTKWNNKSTEENYETIQL